MATEMIPTCALTADMCGCYDGMQCVELQTLVVELNLDLPERKAKLLHRFLEESQSG